MIKVTGCRVLLRPFKIQEHDSVFAAAKRAGIELPEFSERKEQANVDKGTVLQIGESCNQDYVGNVKVGDVIGFAKFGGKFVKETNSEEVFLVINDEDIVCIFEESV